MKMYSRQIAVSLVFAAAAAVYADTEIKFSGDVDYRLRGQWKIKLDSAGTKFDAESYGQFSNVYAWNLRAAVKVNENLNLKFRASNPNGSALETITRNEGAVQDLRVLTIPQAEIQFKAGSFGLSAGLLEVNNSTVLNMVRSAEEQGYTKSLNISDNWSTMYNNSQAGLKLSVNPVKAVSVNLVGSVAEYKAAELGKAVHYDDFRLVGDVPVVLGEKDKFTITPSAAVRSGLTGSFENRRFSSNAGLDVGVKFSDAVSLKAGAAYGQFGNADFAKKDTAGKAADLTRSGWQKPSALLITASPSVKFGKNTVTVGYSFGQSKDLKLEGSAAYSKLFNHADIRWAYEPVKAFSVTPRYRLWVNSDTKSGSNTEVIHRPELMFTAKF